MKIFNLPCCKITFFCNIQVSEQDIVNTKCLLCGGVCDYPKARRITKNNRKKLGIASEDLDKVGATICEQCWLSKTLHNRKPKKCDVKSCTTSRKGLQSQRLCLLPLKNIDSDLKQKVIDRFEINGDEKACRKCRTSVSAFIRSHENELSLCSTTPATTRPVTYGRPRVSYSDANSATKRRMKSAVRDLVQDVVGKCDEISKGDCWKILNDVTTNTPLQDSAKEDV